MTDPKCICGSPAKAWLVYAHRYICDGCTFSRNGETSVPVVSDGTEYVERNSKGFELITLLEEKLRP